MANGIHSARWQKVRRRLLRREPLCRMCSAAGRVRAAAQVDHVEPRHLRPDLAWDSKNLQPLCVPCHTYKSAQESRRRAAATHGGVGCDAEGTPYGRKAQHSDSVEKPGATPS